MHTYLVTFDNQSEPVTVPTGTLLSEAALKAGLMINQPCGGQGRCGRCLVQVISGTVRRRSTLRLSVEDIDLGYSLACQSVIESDLLVRVPIGEQLERRLTSDRSAAEISVPIGYDYHFSQTIHRVKLRITPPSLDDQTDDYGRLLTAIRQQVGYTNVLVSLNALRKIADILREEQWEVTGIFDVQELPGGSGLQEYLIDLYPGHTDDYSPIWGAAIDIGTTTVTVWLADLVSGKVESQVSDYNEQILRGEDVISRIVYSSKPGGTQELQQLVLKTITKLIDTACKRVKEYPVVPADIVKATIAGNSTMVHLFLGLPTGNIRVAPFITAVNSPPRMKAGELGLNINPDGIVDCLPGVASYVGADITAGVYSSGMDSTDELTLFMDVGTNGEIVLGSSEWLVTCACSAGPAFEGAGVLHGMRATRGAIEEVWINSFTFEPTVRIIGGGRAKGICGSGLISLLAEMFMTGLVDKGGNIHAEINSPRIRHGEHGLEYVLVWGTESDTGEDLVITHVDIDNLIRTKGAIYAGYSVLCDSVGIPMELINQMLIGGSFGKYINIEKAVQIGLLPDMPWERFQFLGNTSVKGAYYALLDRFARSRVQEIASRMTYIELSADNSFYEDFMSALFLPHTDVNKFPSVLAALEKK